MQGLEAIISLGGLRSGPSPLEELPDALKEAVLECRADARQVAEVWRRALDADLRHTWSHPVARGIFLAALAHAIEHLVANDPAALATALSALTTQNGARLNIPGTRREVFARAAEALFKEARRKPSDPLFSQMLVVSEWLFSVILSEYVQRAAPHIQRRWYGMRGVCRLVLNSERKSSGMPVEVTAWIDAADDLEAAFTLDNRGASASTYMLDVLLHWIESEPGGNVQAATRFANLLPRLNDEELSCRAVQALIGRYHFTQWFRNTERIDLLENAIAHLDAALRYPVQLAYEDHFVRHVRGQVGVRLTEVLRERDSARADEVAELAAQDLLWACESSPAAFGKHPSLPSLLITRAEWRARDGAYAAARADLRLVLEDPRLRQIPGDLRDHARGRLAQVDVQEVLNTEDPRALAATLRSIVLSPPIAGLNWVIFALAAKRHFGAAGADAENRALLEQVVFCLEKHLPPDTHPLHYRQQYQSHLAGLTTLLMRDYFPERWPEALESCDKAIALFGGETPPSELISLRADLQLQTAKHLLAHGQEAIGEELLAEAAQTFSAVADSASRESSSSFKLDVGYSKAGEAFHRLAALTGARQDVLSAIRYFELAREHGNEAHHLDGLLGDAYYRLYRIGRDAASLDIAIELKQRARTRGGAARENLSVSGRLHYSRWQLRTDVDDLVTSASLVAQAAETDKAWPWPPFQLHEYLGKLSNAQRQGVFEKLARLRPGDELLRVAARDGVEGLARAGALRVLGNEEFQRELLGGRSGVYVLADPHGLLGSSYVFKHTDQVNAGRDVQSVARFREFLIKAGLPHVLLPETLTIFPDPRGKGVVQVMRRARGFQLGQLAIRAAKVGAVPDTSSLKAATRCLAAYHAWATHESPGTISLHKFIGREATGRLAEVVHNLPPTSAQLLMQIGEVPSVRKKDAHPENWLVDEGGRLVMIDFESTKGQPALYDTALLLDDYPFLAINSAGWIERIARCHEYIDTLRTFAPAIPEALRAQAQNIYGLCVVFRCGVNLQRLRFPSDEDRASSATRAGRLRRVHAEGLLLFLSREHPSAGVRDFARAVAARFSSTPAPDSSGLG